MGEYSIPITGLKEGRHEFEFQIDDAFFVHFEETEIQKGLLDATVILDKRSNYFELQINITGKVEVVCDRCLDRFDLPLESSNKLYVRFGDQSYEQTEEVIILALGENEIELAQHLFEYTHLSVPFRKIHSLTEGGRCNEKMLNRLKNVMVDKSSGNDTDPRWDKLKDINLKR